jgi:hypothetical protein
MNVVIAWSLIDLTSKRWYELIQLNSNKQPLPDAIMSLMILLTAQNTGSNLKSYECMR